MKAGANIIACVWFLFSIGYARADQPTTTIASQGKTSIVATSGKVSVRVEIRTHEVQIGKPSDPWPTVRNSSCTYSRIPCSLVDDLTIMVGKDALFIPRSAFCDLADLNSAQITTARGKSILTLYGGDASESYIAKIEFDSTAVKRRSLTSAISSEQPLEETIYHFLTLGD